MKKNIIIIGIGKRTRDDMLPAILASKLFNIIGIYARSGRTINFQGKDYEIKKLEELDNAILEKTEWIYLSVPISSSQSVLKYLNNLRIENIKLLIDTPVFPIRYFWLRIYLKKYLRVFVSEDIVYLPWVLPLKNKIGKLNKIIFDRSVYAYHGVALIKTILDEDYFKKIVLKNIKGREIIEIKSKNGAEVSVIEPRDYSSGSMTFYGQGGEITDNLLSTGVNMRLIIENNICRGIDVAGEIVSFSDEESEVIGEVSDGSSVTSLTLKLKRVGMIRMFNKIVLENEDGWSVKKAVNDIRLYELVHHFGKYLNVSWVLNIFYKK